MKNVKEKKKAPARARFNVFDAVLILLAVLCIVGVWQRHNLQKLFESDETLEAYTVTFEEGMTCMDQRLAPGCIHAEHRSESIYLHQCRGNHDNVCFFRLEWTDSSGTVHIQPGQMVTGTDYSWTDGVEPVLLSIMTSLRMPYSA